MGEFPFEFFDKDGLRMRIRRAVCVKDNHAIVFDQEAVMKQIYEDGARANEDRGKDRGVDFPEITRQETEL